MALSLEYSEDLEPMRPPDNAPTFFGSGGAPRSLRDESTTCTNEDDDFDDDDACPLVCACLGACMRVRMQDPCSVSSSTAEHQGVTPIRVGSCTLPRVPLLSQRWNPETKE